MNYTVKSIAPCKVEATVEVDRPLWKEAQEKGFKKVASSITIPGFRPGKAPEEMLKAKVDQTKVWNEAIDSLLQSVYAQLISENNLRPFARPEIDVIKISDDDLTLKFDIVLAPVVTLGAYTGLTAEMKAPKVTKEEVDKEIENVLKQNADLILVERPIRLGDTVTLDFVGYVKGEDKPFEGGSADNYALEIGSNQFVPGFESQLIGAKSGDKLDIELTFPEQYVAELAGKEALFKVTIHEVKEKKIPELNDETVKELGIKDVSTVEEFKTFEQNHLLSHKVEDAKKEHYEAIVKQIVDGAKVEIAQETITGEVKARIEQIKQQVTSNGLTFDQYLQIIGKTEEELEKQTEVETEASLKKYLCLEEIGIKEKLLISDEELESEVGKLAEQYNMKVEDVKSALGNNLDNLRVSLQSKKIEEWITEYNQGAPSSKKKDK